MALFRTVSLNFWTDSKITDDFTPEDRYFYLYLFTNPHTNLCGCYEISIKQIVNEIGYSRDTVENLLNRFEDYHGVIKYSSSTKEILLINWHKYNWTKSEKFRKPLKNEIDNIKSKQFKEYLLNVFNGNALYGYGINTNCIDTPVTNTNANTNAISDYSSKKNHYGELNNVLLTDEEYEKLVSRFPDYNERIDRLSEYIASKGRKYKSHYATILTWARKEDKEKQQPVKSRRAKEFESELNHLAGWAERRRQNDTGGV